jgi:hypothetical protein
MVAKEAHFYDNTSRSALQPCREPRRANKNAELLRRALRQAGATSQLTSPIKPGRGWRISSPVLLFQGSTQIGVRVTTGKWLRAGRSVVAPDRPSSLNTVLHPAFLKAASCRAGVWSFRRDADVTVFQETCSDNAARGFILAWNAQRPARATTATLNLCCMSVRGRGGNASCACRKKGRVECRGA